MCNEIFVYYHHKHFKLNYYYLSAYFTTNPFSPKEKVRRNWALGMCDFSIFRIPEHQKSVGLKLPITYDT